MEIQLQDLTSVLLLPIMPLSSSLDIPELSKTDHPHCFIKVESLRPQEEVEKIFIMQNCFVVMAFCFIYVLFIPSHNDKVQQLYICRYREANFIKICLAS